MKRLGLLALGVAAASVAAWQAAPALQNSIATEAAKPAAATAPKPAQPTVKAEAPKPAAQPIGKTTAMAERVAVLGLLNKRNGLSRDLTLKPGQAVRIGDVVVRLQACETTAPWEVEQLTGAFAQVTVQGADKKWRRVFSGWLYKESPSLNVVEHPIYDVWTKDCQMRHMDTGEGTTIARGESASGNGSSAPRKRSSAPKSPSAADSAPEPVEDVADDNLDL
jgi:hypothetical protein